MNRQNVIVILADDLGIGDLSCFNQKSQLCTENLDKLASQGMRCTDAHASSALCTPSRYGLLTGRYNWRSRLKKRVLGGHESHLIEAGRLTLGSMFKKFNYTTACIGKWHLGLDWEPAVNPDTYGMDPDELGVKMRRKECLSIDYGKPVKNGPNAYGFDYCYVTPGSLDIAPYVFIENEKITAKPAAITGTEDFWPTKNTGTEKDIPYISGWPIGNIAPNFDHMEVVPDSADRVLRLIDEYSCSDEPFFIYYPIHAPHVPCLPTPEFEGKSSLGPYGDMVLMIDDIIGRIMKKLEDKELDQNTLVVFTSDNGGEHEFQNHSTNYSYRGYKSDIWDGGHRIPYIVKYPGVITPGSICDKTVCLTDLMATFAEILGYKLCDNEGEDSISNLSLWQGGGSPVRDSVIHHSGEGMFSIRRGSWKLIMCQDGGGFNRPGSPSFENEPPIQLYDMENDSRETTNLSDKHPDIVADLVGELTSCITNGRSTPGAFQRNTDPDWWPELNWIPKPAK